MSFSASQVTLPIKITPVKSITSLSQTASSKTPEHVSPAVSKVNELSEKKRTRAHSVASTIEESLENGDARAIFLRIQAFKANNNLRLDSDVDEGWEAGDNAIVPPQSGLRNTFPVIHRAPDRRPQRLVVSAPVVPLMQPRSVFTQPVPNSPLGNAWSGAHFWEPQFGEALLHSPSANYKPAESLPTLEKAAYDSVKEEVDMLAHSIYETSKEHDAIGTDECELIAAERVLEERNAEYVRDFEYPSPTSMASRVFALAAEERRLLAEFSVKNPTQLLDVDHWLAVDGDTDLNNVITEFSKPPSYEFRTILDHVKDHLHLLKLRRKSADHELSGLAYGLVSAVQIFEVKLRRWQEGGDSSEGSSGDEDEYGVFLKSVSEELASTSQGRVGSATAVVSARADPLDWRRKMRFKGSLGSTGSQIREEADTLPLEARPRRSTSPTKLMVGWNEDLSPLGMKMKRKSLAQATASSQGGEASRSGLTIRRSSLAMAQLTREGYKEEASPSDVSMRRRFEGRRGGGLEERRLKGKAPSALDLKAWAQELKRLEEEEGEVGVAITKDD